MTSSADDAARSHGGQVHAAARRLGCDIGAILDLSASLNPFAPSIDPAWHYPDPTVATNAMAAAPGLRTRDTAANWLLVDDVAPTLVDDLARHRILVRDCTSFGMPHTVRIAVPDDVGLDRLDRALRALDVRGRLS